MPGKKFEVPADELIGGSKPPDSPRFNDAIRRASRSITVVAAQSPESQTMNARIRAGADGARQARQPTTPPAAPDRRSMNELIHAGARRRSPGADDGASMTDIIRAAAGRPAKPPEEE